MLLRRRRRRIRMRRRIRRRIRRRVIRRSSIEYLLYIHRPYAL